jgi:hypothetical protein
MADGAALSNYQDWLFELQGAFQRLFPAEFVLLSLLSGVMREDTGVIRYDPSFERFTRPMDGNREYFDGSQVRFPLLLSGLPGGGTVTESQTWNAGGPLATAKAIVNLANVLQPVQVTIPLERDSKYGSTSAMSAVENYLSEAYKAVARIENDMLHGNGDALLAAVSGAGGSPGLTIPVSAANAIGAGANFDQLTPGRWVDILTRANGADPGNGKRRKINSVSRSGATITVDTNQQASDGGSGNVTFSANEGVYITGSYNNGIAGLTQAVATSGVFEQVNKANVQQWQGVDATPAASQALNDALLDNAVYLLRGNGVGASDFGITHPKTVDLYKQGKISLSRLDPKEIIAPAGFAGISYQGADRPFPILKDLAAPRGIVRLVYREAIKLYGDHVGPAFIDDDGGQFRFFTRTLLKEADLLDRVQAAFVACNKLATIGNATTALTEAP